MNPADKEMQALLQGIPDKSDRALAEVIMRVNRVDERKIVNDIIQDIATNRLSAPEIIHIDLSVDRTTQPLRLTGAGNYLAAFDATDNNAIISVSLQRSTDRERERFGMKRGRRLRFPFTEIYIYHAAQANKTMQLVKAVGFPSLPIGVEDDSGSSSNSDLVTSLGNSNAATTGQVTATGSSGVLVTENTARKRITIMNPSGSPVYFALGEAATTAKAIILPNSYLTLNTTAEIRVITSGGSIVLGYMEE